jgi:hypothetical protein
MFSENVGFKEGVAIRTGLFHDRGWFEIAEIEEGTTDYGRRSRDSKGNTEAYNFIRTRTGMNVG